MSDSSKDLLVQGLWKNNSALVQLLGLCPLLAVSSATNALGPGLATTLVLVCTNVAVSALRRWSAIRNSHPYLCDDYCFCC